MTRGEAQATIRRIAAGPSERVFLGQHAKHRAPARGKLPLSKPEIIAVLGFGWIVEGPVADNGVRGGWKITVRRQADRHLQEVVGVLLPEDSMFVITGYEDRPKRRRPVVGDDTE